MGICCCQSASIKFENPAHTFHDKIPAQTPSSATTTSTQLTQKQPILALAPSHSDDKSQICQMSLCDHSTSQLCPISANIIEVLSIYHLFIQNFDPLQPDNNSNISQVISDKLNGYDLTTLHDEYHHILSYHDTNSTFMRSLCSEVMQLDTDNDIQNLLEIGAKLNDDQQKQLYFGHKLDEDIAMIQALNQIHETTVKHAVSNSFGSEIAPEIVDDVVNANGAEIDMDENKNDGDDDVTDHAEHGKIGKLKTKMKAHKNGYQKSKTKDVDFEDEDVAAKNELNIDVKYVKDEKKKRKVGRLKKRKSSGKQSDGKHRGKHQEILADDAWMDQKLQKKRKHVVSESVQMLGNTRLVTMSSWKSELNVVDEDINGYDLSTMDLDIDLEELNTEEHGRKRFSKKVRSPSANSMFDENYEVDN